jgi:alcohol dehydrogenase class IV
MDSDLTLGTRDGAPARGEYGFLPIEKVKFGPGAVSTLGEELDRLGGSRVLLVTGRTLATKTDLVERIRGLLGGRCAGVFSETRQHVPRSSVIAGAEMARATEADAVVSFGGGSPIDTAKLIALCLAAEVTAEDDLDRLHFREEHGQNIIPPQPPSSIPHVAISTTLSAGEFTGWAGSTDTRVGVKHAYGVPHIVPRLVILDPELSAATPAWLWGTTGMKAFDHAIETVCSSQPQPFADALALRAIEMLARSLTHAAANPADLAARGSCQLAAWMSIMSLPSVPAGLSHALGHQLGARCNVPHGVTSCIVLPAVLDFNRSSNSARQRMVAEAMGIDTTSMDDEGAGATAAERLRQIVRELGAKDRLREWNVTEEDLRAIAADAVEDFMSLTNPRPIESSDQVLELLRGVY